MGADRFGRLEQAFHRLLELPTTDERHRELDRLATSDSDLASELSTLLAAFEDPSPVFRSSGDSPPAADAASDPLVGRRAGSYRLLRRLGEGGMGRVYLAARDDESYHALAAVKVLADPGGSRDLRRRFHSERQLLATLDHPNIARLLDAGEMPDGTPFFVMELVAGLRIDRYCARQGLALEQRVELLETVCTAADHAHQRGIVHRDLKPSNVLVTDDGVPKLVDFGIAKLVAGDADNDGGDDTTRTGSHPLTPRYAAPEQLAAGTITPATDVYALGAVLQEIVDGDGTTDAPPPADLRKILAVALAAEPERRYSRAGELAEDLHRFRHGQPVSARRGTAWYRLTKWVRRHRAASAAAVLGLLLLVLLAGIAGRSSGRAERERMLARHELSRAEELRGALIALFREADSPPQGDDGAKARDLLDRTAHRAMAASGAHPEEGAGLLISVGSLYTSLGFYEEARPLFERAIELRQAALGSDHPLTLEALTRRASLRLDEGDFESGEQELAEIIERQEAVVDRSDPGLVQTRSLHAMAIFRAGRPQEARDLIEAALPDQRRAFSADDPAIANSFHILAMAEEDLGNPDRAFELYQQALAIRRRTLGRFHPETLPTMKNLALMLIDRRELTAAEELYSEILAAEQRLFGNEHPRIAFTLSHLARLHFVRSDLATAESLHRRALDMRQRLLGPEHPAVVVSLTNLADVVERQERLPEAATLYRRAVDLARRRMPPGSPDLAYPLSALGKLTLQLGNPDEAEPMLREALALRTGALPAGHPLTVNTALGLGDCLLELQRVDEAEELFQASLESLRAADRPTSPAQQRLAQVARVRTATAAGG